MFMPPDRPEGARGLRIAFANLDQPGIGTLIDRLASLAP
jgi:hypothetical protein